MKRIGRKKIHIVLIITAAVAFMLSACAPVDGFEAAEEIPAVEEPVIIEKEPVRLLITCVGDVMVHQSQIPAQYDSASDTYDYNNNFLYIKKYIQESDLALFNLETTFGGRPYAGYPVFSAPDELAQALGSAGFDVAITANNHMLDRGVSGLARTIGVLKENGFLVTGSVESRDNAPRYAMTEAKGVKIAVAAFTYASGSVPGNLLLNGSAVSREAEELINYFRYEQIDEDLENVRKIVDEARNAGADIVITYYHWGDEYQLKPNRFQKYIAEKTANDIGADIIFASHTHTPQEIDFITDEATGKRTLVFYSMGNFISNQRVETLDVSVSKYTEIGMIARVSLEYDMDNREITYLAADAIPTWVEKYKSGGRDIYAVIPLDGELDGNEALAASGHLGRAKKAWEDANGIFGAN